MGTSGLSVLLDTADYPSDPVVVLVGITLVFLILLLLTLLITLQGKVFDRLTASQKAKKAKAAPSAAVSAPPAPAASPTAPVIEEGIPPEVVAVIAAAVASMDGGTYTLRSLTRAGKGRGAWGLAGVASDTEPF